MTHEKNTDTSVCDNAKQIKSKVFKASQEQYKSYMFNYGILSVLFVLKHYEENENYEECLKIMDSIRAIESKLEIQLFTTITKENIEQVIEVYSKFNLTGVNVIENSKYYSKLIIKEIEGSRN